jgi:hypothetical protein
LIPDIEKFLPVTIFKMVTTIPHKFNIVRLIYPHIKCRRNRTMLNLCDILATGRNFSMSGINSGHIESSTGKSARQGNLRHPLVWCRRFPCLALFASVWIYFSLSSPVFSFVFVYVLISMFFLFKINNLLYISFQSFINTQILTISHIIT